MTQHNEAGIDLDKLGEFFSKQPSEGSHDYVTGWNECAASITTYLARRAPAPADERSKIKTWRERATFLPPMHKPSTPVEEAMAAEIEELRAHQAAPAQLSAANATASEGGSKCQYPNCGCTSRATCNYNYDRAAPRNAHADDSLKANSLDGQNAADLANKSTTPTSDQQAGAVAAAGACSVCAGKNVMCEHCDGMGIEPRRIIGYGDCKCVLSKYCDGKCNPIYAAPAAIEQAGAQPVLWYDPSAIVRERMTAYAESIEIIGASVKFGNFTTPLYTAPTPATDQDALDAKRYRAIRHLMQTAKGSASIEVNQYLAYYDQCEPGEEVKLQWYPDTPIGFYTLTGYTLDDVADQAVEYMAATPVTDQPKQENQQ